MTALPDATDRNNLTDRQELALAALMAGATHTEAAEAASVHRVTVTKWANEDAEFIAERNRRRTSARSAIAAKVRNLTGRAVDVVASAIELEAAQGGSAVSLRVLNLVGYQNLPTESVGPTTAQQVEEMWDEQADLDLFDTLFGPMALIRKDLGYPSAAEVAQYRADHDLDDD
jgi:hypothetical protein